MLFSSLVFLGLFLPVTLLVYFLVPRRWRNLVLFLFSLLFYGWGEPVYLFLMLFTIAADFFLGLLVAKTHSRAHLGLAVVLNLALLGFFKYYDLFASLVGLPTLGIPLPIGISFYTFQALSYVVDVYRGTPAQKSFVRFGTYITMFPQLIAGPIVRYGDIADELDERHPSFERAERGILRFVCGLSKKVLLANPAGEIWNYFASLPERSVTGAWLGLIFYAFQIYFDFSGYSDMAVGLGEILGFRFPENFNYPYCARSIRDFWHRWHISLSDWFREYVYIPLGGNRKGEARTLLNMLAVWSLTGLWHGTSVNFLLWGVYYFLLLAAERLFLGKWLARLPRFLGHAYSLFAILLGWLIFACPDMGAFASYFSSLFALSGEPLTLPIDRYELSRNAVLLLVMAVASTPLFATIWRKKDSSTVGRVALAGGAVVIFVFSVAHLAASSYNPFLYFRF